jgi:hypothetical protein
MRSARMVVAAACMGSAALACGSNNEAACDDGGTQSSLGLNGADAAGDALAAGDSLGASDGQPAAEGGEDALLGVLEDSGNSAPAPLSWVRFANWSPDAPGVDFCMAPHGSGAFVGPLVAELAAATDAGTTFTTSDGGTLSLLNFPLVSAYESVAPGQYDVRTVVAGASSCTAAIGPDATGLPALSANGLTTIALLGEDQPVGGDPGLQIQWFADDSTPSSSGIAMRFINASPALAQADVGKGVLPKFTPIFQGVAFGRAGTATEAQIGDAAPPFVDRNGYVTTGATSNATLSVYPSGTEAEASTLPTVTSSAWSAAAGAIVTIAIVGGTSAGEPASLLQCADNAGTVGAVSDCAFF